MRLFRLYVIAKTVLQHGLDDLIPKRFMPWYGPVLRHALFWLSNKYPEKSEGERLRLALQSLGPVFVKFGQMLSTRRDLLSQEIADELALLQDRVAPFGSQEAQILIEKALGISDLAQVFSEFELTPLASASIAQVHSATLKEDNQQVVVKVIRPNISKTINADLLLMHTLAQALQKWLPDGKRLRPVEVVQDYRKTIIDELDLSYEASNGKQFRHNFEGSDSLFVPHIYENYCRKNVLVMDRIYGIPVSDVARLQANGTNLKRLAEKGVEIFFTQVFRDSFFHADMHPGNIFVSPETPDNPKYIAIDYGIVGTLNKDDKRYLAENFVAFFNRDYRKVAELHVASGWVPADTSVDEFETAIRAVCEPIFHKPLEEISFGNVLLQLFNTARRFNMVVQPQLVLLQKTLLYVEGLGRQLYPKLDLWETAKPFLENWMQEQMGVKALLKKLQSNLPYWSEKAPELPDLLFDGMRQLRQLPDRQQQWQEQLLRQQAAAEKRRHLGLLGASLLVVAGVMPLYNPNPYALGGLLLASAVCWGVAFRR